MKTIYVTSDRLGAESLKQQLAEFSPSTDLAVSARADEARRFLASDVVDAVLIDTGLPEEDTAGLLADVRQYHLPLVVIVAAASAVRSSAFWALQADYVWAYDADTGYSRSPQRFARDVSVAIRQAVERCRAENTPPTGPVRTVYIGGDDEVRGFLSSAPDVRMTTADDPGCDVAVIDASPYDAIQPLRELRVVAPTLPVVLLCGADIQDPDEVSYVLGVDRVLVKSGDWLPQLLTLVNSVVGQGRRLTEGREQAMVASGAPHLDSGIASTGAVNEFVANRLPVENSGDRARSNVDARAEDPQRSVQGSTDVGSPGAEGGATVESSTQLEAFTPDQQQELATRAAQCAELQRRLDEAGASEARLVSMLEAERAEWSARLETLSAHQQQERATYQAARDELQRQLDETRAGEARLTSMLEAERAEWTARLETLAVHQQQELARERAQREEIALRLQVTHDDARRKARLSALTDGVVTELDSLVDKMAAQATRAAEDAPHPSPLAVQLDRTRRTAGRARDLARRFLAFRRGQADPPEPIDLNRLILDLAPTLQQLVGSQSELLLRIESTAAPVSLSHEPIRRLLFSLAVLCGDALPIGGQVIVETKNVEMVPSWDADVPRAEPLPFVRLTVTTLGHAPQPIRVTPSLESIAQQCGAHCEEVSTDDPSTGLCLSLPRSGWGQ